MWNILFEYRKVNTLCSGNGTEEIIGKIITLMRTINYVATGKITSDSLSLSITDDRYVLKITGTEHRS